MDTTDQALDFLISIFVKSPNALSRGFPFPWISPTSCTPLSCTSVLFHASALTLISWMTLRAFYTCKKLRSEIPKGSLLGDLWAPGLTWHDGKISHINRKKNESSVGGSVAVAWRQLLAATTPRRGRPDVEFETRTRSTENGDKL